MKMKLKEVVCQQEGDSSSMASPVHLATVIEDHEAELRQATFKISSTINNLGAIGEQSSSVSLSIDESSKDSDINKALGKSLRKLIND